MSKQDMIQLIDGQYRLLETVYYPNKGYSRFFLHTKKNQIVILDHDICRCGEKESVFSYTLITDKQNAYMHQYKRVYRFLEEDAEQICEVLSDKTTQSETDYFVRTADRGEGTDSSPLEFLFEKCFQNVYGMDSVKYLWKEYGIADLNGKNYFLDYYVRTNTGSIAVEENGVSYHHPQIIGVERYRQQLRKQNVCAMWGIRLFRFSTEDCVFTSRMEDDIRDFFGTNSSEFVENGILADRKISLYEHQENTLQEIQKQRSDGVSAFLVVLPTASGKSKIVEEDLKLFAKDRKVFRALIMAPNLNILEDWHERIHQNLPEFESDIEICSFAAMSRRYHQMRQDYYDYIVIDEAHHAVAPVLKRVIRYFTPAFLIGLTATDQRPDKKKLESIFGSYQTGLSLQEAMEKNIIARANVFRIETNLDLSKVRFNGKEYVNADLEKTIRVTSRNELIADVLKQYFCRGEISSRQGVIFCVNTAHAAEMERVLTEYGISAKAYTRKARDPERIMQDFRDKKIRFLCACEMISEGWDYPELGILVMARPTMSKVLYLQQIGRGLRRTNTKENVFVIDVVDEYGAVVKPCTMHSIFANPYYVPFGDICRRDYQQGDIIEIDGLHETIERITPVDVESFEEKYGSYLNQEQLAREFFMSTGSIVSWIKKDKITPSVVIPFGSRKIYLFSPEEVEAIRTEYQIPVHNDETIRDDFFAFLEERDYSLSYKMPFLLSFIRNMNSVGEAEIKDVLKDYIAFYQDRVDRGLVVDRRTCPYNGETLKDKKMIQQNMLTNPFEKFERKRFLYYSSKLGMIAMNPALFRRLEEGDLEKIREQMEADLKDYYQKLGTEV